MTPLRGLRGNEVDFDWSGSAPTPLKGSAATRVVTPDRPPRLCALCSE